MWNQMRRSSYLLVAICLCISNNDALKFELCCRRSFVLSTIGSLSIVPTPNDAAAAERSQNPLTLRGSFWETGKLYQATNMREYDEKEDQELLRTLEDAAVALKSLDDLAEDGKFDALSAALRGAVVSEPEIRSSVRVLLDREEDDAIETRGQAAYSRFTRLYDILDNRVITAARKTPGGSLGSLGMAVISPFQVAGEVARVAVVSPGDDRIELISEIGETASSLKELCRVLAVGAEYRLQ